MRSGQLGGGEGAGGRGRAGADPCLQRENRVMVTSTPERDLNGLSSPAAHPRDTGRAGVSQQFHVLRSGPALAAPDFLLRPCSEQRSASHCQKLQTLPRATGVS